MVTLTLVGTTAMTCQVSMTSLDLRWDAEARRSVVMPIAYTNAKEKTFYLHQGTTTTGKPKYYFSPQPEGTLAASLPEGFEIYENPNAQVFLRRVPLKVI